MFNKLKNKILYLKDKISYKDKKTLKQTLYKTNIKVFCSDTGECIFETANKVILPGSAFTARAHWDIPRQEVTPSYNTALGLDDSLYTDPISVEKVFLFAVGTDGCGRENSQVFEENYGMWTTPESLVPFIHQEDDIDDNMKNIYFGKKTKADSISYYFKKFESDPIFNQQYVDGAPIDNTVYTNGIVNEIESFVEVRLKITKDECRDFFISSTGLNDARVNTLSLLTAWASDINGRTVYQDIRPLTKLNFPNESLIDLLKGVDIVYQIYY